MTTNAHKTYILCFTGFLALSLSYLFLPYFQVHNIGNGFFINDEIKAALPFEDVPIASSAWCSGYNVSERFCVFKNLCYSVIFEDFVFYHGRNSQLSGFPNDRFDPALAELSSVRDHNTQYFNYVDLPSESFNKSETVFFAKPTLLFSRFHPDNLMHVFHDDLLPLYATLSKICKHWYDKSICDVSVLFTDRKPWGPFKSLYKDLFKEVKLIQNFIGFKTVCFKEVHVGVNKETVWYQYGFKYPQGPVAIQRPIGTFSFVNNFRDYFEKVCTNDLPGKTDDHVLILTRKSNRRILNVNALNRTISIFLKSDVKVLNLEEYNIQEIISYVKRSSLVVGMHGSLLILSLFLRPNSILIELFPYAVNPAHYTPYKTLAQLPGMNITYEAWQNLIVENTFSYPNNPPATGGISHLPLEEQVAISKSKEVPRHVCCDNTEWLFRIYQDTIVDLNSFQSVLEKGLLEQQSLRTYGDASLLSELHPTKVSDPLCHINITARTMTVEWKKPWNIDFFKIYELQYELWIQTRPANDGDDLNVYVLSKSSHIFVDIDVNVDYLMWVKCIANNKSGLFTTACECSKA